MSWWQIPGRRKTLPLELLRSDALLLIDHTKGMKILFLTSAHNSLSQRAFLELVARGHSVHVVIASDDTAMAAGVGQHKPELIICPMLKKAVPKSIWSEHVCLIVHPGIRGDRGPSSLDWALMEGRSRWGVTLLQAIEEMDMGPIWSFREFDIPTPCDKSAAASTACRSAGDFSKSFLYRSEVTRSAVECIIEAVDRFQDPSFLPTPVDYSDAAVRGSLKPTMKQDDRRICWLTDTAADVCRKIRAADSQPGVLDTICNVEYFCYGAHTDFCYQLRQEGSGSIAPGDVIGKFEGAVCRATVDGAVWITHLKRRGTGPGCGIKLPAAMLLEASVIDALPVPKSPPPCQEIHYHERNGVGYLSFDFYNGAMSTEQCRRLLSVYEASIAAPSTRVVVLLGGRDFWSNGIHLNTIEASMDAAEESWKNINAIDDFVRAVLATRSHYTVCALQGNAGAGGVMMALAGDKVFVRGGVVLNPHYRTMGLYGSEYWTYSLPKRVGKEMAQRLTTDCQPIVASAAKEIGLVDDVFGEESADMFLQEVMRRAEEIAGLPEQQFKQRLKEKLEARDADEKAKPLEQYRNEELAEMHRNFFGPDSTYHQCRATFVYRIQTCLASQRKIAAASEPGLNPEDGLLQQPSQKRKRLDPPAAAPSEWCR